MAKPAQQPSSLTAGATVAKGATPMSYRPEPTKGPSGSSGVSRPTGATGSTSSKASK